VRRNGLPQPPAGAGDSSTLGMILNRRIMMQSPGRPKFGSYASSLSAGYLVECVIAELIGADA